jgi:hypothetical protein
MPTRKFCEKNHMRNVTGFVCRDPLGSHPSAQKNTHGYPKVAKLEPWCLPQRLKPGGFISFNRKSFTLDLKTCSTPPLGEEFLKKQTQGPSVLLAR